MAYGDSVSYTKNKALFPAFGIFMTLYILSFAIGLLAMPSLFAGSSPVAYWVNLGVDATFFARCTGAGMLAIGLGSRFNSLYRPIFLEQVLGDHLLIPATVPPRPASR